jgi:hypothetical protein
VTAASFMLDEAYAPVLLAAKAQRLRATTGNEQYRSNYVTEVLRQRVVFERAVVHPLKLLFMSPIVFLLSLHVTLVYSYLYLLFTTFTVIFQEQYHISTGAAGFSFLGLSIGCIIGVIALGNASDRIFVALGKKYNNGVGKPEYRLQLMVGCSLFVPIDLFWYGWC